MPPKGELYIQSGLHEVSQPDGTIPIDTDAGPLIAKLIYEMCIRGDPNTKARQLAELLKLSWEEVVHPLTDDYYKLIFPDSAGNGPVSSLLRKVLTDNNPALLFTPDENFTPAGTHGLHPVDTNAVPDIAPQGFTGMFEHEARSACEVLAGSRPPGPADLLLRRMISQALIILDKAHPESLRFGSPENALAWLRLMAGSEKFRRAMIQLVAATYVAGSATTPPVQILSPESPVPYARLTDELVNTAGQSCRSMRHADLPGYSHKIHLKTMWYCMRVQTTGIGRHREVTNRLIGLIGSFGFGYLEDRPRITFLNIGSGPVQNGEMRARLLDAGFPGDSIKMVGIDAREREELLSSAEIYIFAGDSSNPVLLKTNHAAAIAAVFNDDPSDILIPADLRFPLDENLTAQLQELGPNVILSTNCIIPHLSGPERVQLITDLMRVCADRAIIDISGGYIGHPALVNSITLLFSRENDGTVVLVPVVLSVTDGWQTPDRSIFINVKSSMIRDIQQPTVRNAGKAAYYSDKLPGQQEPSLTISGLLFQELSGESFLTTNNIPWIVDESLGERIPEIPGYIMRNRVVNAFTALLEMFIDNLPKKLRGIKLSTVQLMLISEVWIPIMSSLFIEKKGMFTKREAEQTVKRALLRQLAELSTQREITGDREGCGAMDSPGEDELDALIRILTNYFTKGKKTMIPLRLRNLLRSPRAI